MRSPRSWLVWVLLSCLSGPLAAHDVPPSIVMIDIGRNTLDLEVQLQLSELGAALQLPLASSPDSVLPRFGPRIERYIRDSLQIRTHDGRAYTQSGESLAMRRTNDANWTSNDWLVVHTRLQAPDGASTETFSLDYSVILQRVVSHKALIYVRRDVRNGLLGDRPLLIGVMGFGSTHLDVDGSDGSWWHGFSHLFALGMKHIAAGSDHLLFLITLLLPTPLIASARRWRDRKSVAASARTIVGVVSGFTLGHSLTLALGSSGWVVLPARAVEVAIAISILVSSIHAWRPLFPGKEAWIASTFGLIHGLAFAEVLSGLNFDGWTLALSLLGFNLGIESMQLLVIAATLPPLILLSSTRYYTGVRLVGAGFAAVCALGWILERAFNLANPLAPVVDWLASPPAWLVAAICGASAPSIGLLFRGAPSCRTPTSRSVFPARLSLRSANKA
jgi:hypothetical protein